MVEKNVAYNRDARSEGFADNDPLAELARIVGFEDRPSHAGSEAAPSATRREPEFNLEDELLREFEVYDAPHADPVVLDPANDVRAGIHPNDFMQRVEQVFARREPELSPAAEPQVEARYAPEPMPAYEVAPEVTEEPLPEVDQAYIHNYVETSTQDIRADFRDDAGAVAEVFDVHSRQPRAAEPVVYQQAAQQLAWEEPQAIEPAQPEWHAMPELAADVSSNIPSSHGYAPEPQAFDLADEVEIAVAEEAPAPVSVRPPSQGGRSSLEFSSLRLPLANFGARRDVSAVDPRRVEPRSEQQPAARIEPQVEPVPAPAVIQAEETAPAFMPPVAEAFVPAAQAVTPPVVQKPVATNLSPMDELIYDVAKYSIPGRGEEPVVQSAPVVQAAPAVQAARVEPQVAATPVRTTPVAPAVPAQEPDFSDFAGFNDDDFELALDDLDLDLDLSEIAEAEVAPAPAPQPVRQQPVAPVVAAAAPQPVREQPAPQPRVAPVAAPIAAAAPVQPRPAAPAPQPVVPQTLESLPFDPSQIGETEEHPETIVEMDVPELPVGVFEAKPVARRHEEDLDIDTELATLFAPAVAGGLDRHKHAENRGAAPQARAAAQAPEEADEFERALEEDFRRSMQEAAASRGNPRDAENTYVNHQAAYRDEDERGGRRWIMPVAAAIGLVLVGGGVYALISGGSSSTGSNGAPVIISADNDPMKVVPENPGGRVVPNQDKAVYDRVAGGSAADPKQPALISSSEQPVDVVQRTLIPEQLPLEGENDADMEAAAGTPVGETEDPRLLSPEEKAAQNEGAGATGVSPRKVRTMIVKPDGTLVAQEVDAPAAQPPKADKVAELAAPQTAKPGEGAPAVIAASRVPVAPEQAAAQPQAHTPATPASQTAAPLPSARPSSQPSNVVATVTNQGNVRPAATAPAQPPAAQQQTAAATTSTPSAGGYYIQIASLPSQAEAQKSYQNMSAKFGSVIGGRGVDIKAAEIAGKGTFYRVRIPAGDKNEAVALCEKFRSAGGSCLVAR
ncbi:SPOR domain-containing protein [Rhizobium oryzihabitans]|uniref:SPOR domain-containing protein n=1 Tax=Rhizobium oryzihabitans TaxID=2267833 RepID=A0A7L5BE88_9HYPH|nr:SPOR domain-containing protein [Rhizobium oryzihabitans]QCM04976.1 SPOR domain-containing protein [Agrobacterium tumefaciens]QIB37023.1 SPOR domain-containing protein [Rhizobium oryzihabitans]CUX19870.1 conserved hypothetical protein [Agrobacterium genomosp. 5 str. CFBP 6626]